MTGTFLRWVEVVGIIVFWFALAAGYFAVRGVAGFVGRFWRKF